MDVFVFKIVPFFTILIFILGISYRFYTWKKTPQPGAMTLFPVPHESTSLSIIKEVVFFPSLFRSDKTLWGFSWIFHAALALIFIGHVRVFTDFPALWKALSIDADVMSAVSGGIVGIIIMIAAILLLFRRFGSKRVREISGFPDYFALLLILAIVVTGNLMRFGEHFDLQITREYFSQLFTLSFAGMEIPQNPTFRLHFLLAQLLIIYIPFSKMLHFGGIFFTQTLIKRT
ncbi:respiratory nitrate reductase subunit gamma [bacterium]|nr:respiratory nitrate reductase subunit gamma [bacterium]